MEKLLATCMLLIAFAIQANFAENEITTSPEIQQLKNVVNNIISDLEEEISDISVRNYTANTVYYDAHVKTISYVTNTVNSDVDKAVAHARIMKLRVGDCAKNAKNAISLASRFVTNDIQSCFKIQSDEATRAIKQLESVRLRGEHLLTTLDNINLECSSEEPNNVTQNCIATKQNIDDQVKTQFNQEVQRVKDSTRDNLKGWTNLSVSCYSRAIDIFYKSVKTARSSTSPCIKNIKMPYALKNNCHESAEQDNVLED